MFKYIRSDFDAEAFRAKHSAARSRRLAKIDILEGLDEADDKLGYLDDKLVPVNGPAQSVAGELIRAMLQLYTCSDPFYTDEGAEKCGSAAYYISDIISDADALLVDITYSECEDSEYDDKIEELKDIVINYIINNSSLLTAKNDIDMDNEPNDYFKDLAPRYSYDVSVPEIIRDHIYAGHIDEEDYRMWLEEFDFNDDSYISYENGDYSFEDLDKASFKELELYFDKWVMEYADTLDGQYSEVI